MTSLPVLVLAATRDDGLAHAESIGLERIVIKTPRTLAKDGLVFRALVITPAFTRLIDEDDEAAQLALYRARRDAVRLGVRV